MELDTIHPSAQQVVQLVNRVIIVRIQLPPRMQCWLIHVRLVRCVQLVLVEYLIVKSMNVRLDTIVLVRVLLPVNRVLLVHIIQTLVQLVNPLALIVLLACIARVDWLNRQVIVPPVIIALAQHRHQLNTLVQSVLIVV